MTITKQQKEIVIQTFVTLYDPSHPQEDNLFWQVMEDAADFANQKHPNSKVKLDASHAADIALAFWKERLDELARQAPPAPPATSARPPIPVPPSRRGEVVLGAVELPELAIDRQFSVVGRSDLGKIDFSQLTPFEMNYLSGLVKRLLTDDAFKGKPVTTRTIQDWLEGDRTRREREIYGRQEHHSSELGLTAPAIKVLRLLGVLMASHEKQVSMAGEITNSANADAAVGRPLTIEEKVKAARELLLTATFAQLFNDLTSRLHSAVHAYAEHRRNLAEAALRRVRGGSGSSDPQPG